MLMMMMIGCDENDKSDDDDDINDNDYNDDDDGYDDDDDGYDDDCGYDTCDVCADNDDYDDRQIMDML